MAPADAARSATRGGDTRLWSLHRECYTVESPGAPWLCREAAQFAGETRQCVADAAQAGLFSTEAPLRRTLTSASWFTIDFQSNPDANPERKVPMCLSTATAHHDAEESIGTNWRNFSELSKDSGYELGRMPRRIGMKMFKASWGRLWQNHDRKIICIRTRFC